MLRELSRSYLTIVKDLSRVMNRLKAVYRSWAIPCAGRDVHYRRHRSQWLAKIREAGACGGGPNDSMSNWTCCNTCGSKRGGELLAESRKHAITAKLRQIPFPRADSSGAGRGPDPNTTSFPYQAATLGPIARSGLRRARAENTVLSRVRCGALKETAFHSRSEQRPQSRSERSVQSCRHQGQCASRTFQNFYCGAALAKGVKPTMARFTLARKIAAITLTLWKKGGNFDPEKLKSQAA